MGLRGGSKGKKLGNDAFFCRSARYYFWIPMAILFSGFIYVMNELRTNGPCKINSYSSVMRYGQPENVWTGDLRTLDVAWNGLCFGSPPEKLRVAVFSKKWPVGGAPGGMERHALTLHTALARRGHEIHVYTVPADGSISGKKDMVQGGLHVHFVQNNLGRLNCSAAWENLARVGHVDVVHSESVALPHYRAKEVPNLAATWHGIGYEALHSELIQDLLRKPGESRSAEIEHSMGERLPRLLDEIRFFPSYKHHVPISDYAGEVLRNIYQIPSENVHIILNGVDEHKFRPDPALGAAFRAEFGVPSNATLVMGVAGRLVKDKGHPVLFQAFSEIRKAYKGVYLVIAGAGPWEERYKEFAPNAVVVGAMNPARLAAFYNALDVFLNPTLRPQGLDLTLLEAMQCGKPLLASRFPSITRSVIVSPDFGYTFHPNVGSLIKEIQAVIGDGPHELRRKGRSCRVYAARMFTASKMASAYERLFLCLKNESYCQYPLSFDCPDS
ncbi:hypothetical protein SUGI_0985120 [Cryptomeria japonica]|uniref:uncharacterized protein LOC131076743 n=1 Tax=Cryptomeria japonica TaxID=3369 RepID=UPI002414BB87|nr:uncharacterized protein LOC131076743 [Cryptomeria japonica]GLJ46724.1 hypothetical protein SUGI_0985120 [Cryptomeria japonica]